MRRSCLAFSTNSARIGESPGWGCRSSPPQLPGTATPCGWPLGLLRTTLARRARVGRRGGSASDFADDRRPLGDSRRHGRVEGPLIHFATHPSADAQARQPGDRRKIRDVEAVNEQGRRRPSQDLERERMKQPSSGLQAGTDLRRKSSGRTSIWRSRTASATPLAPCCSNTPAPTGCSAASAGPRRPPARSV